MGFLFLRFKVYDVVGSLAHYNLYGEDRNSCVLSIIARMEMLFSEEAEKMWNKQEAIWNREEDARKKLMDDVLDGLKEQKNIKNNHSSEKDFIL